MPIKPMDSRTGEVLEGRFAWIPAKRVNGFGEDWIAMSQNAMKTILGMKTAGEISGRDLDVLLMLTTVLDFENDVVIQQTDIAESLSMRRPHVSRSLSNLVQREILLEGRRVGRNKAYKLNPWIGWKGSARNHRRHLQLVHSMPPGFTP